MSSSPQSSSPPPSSASSELSGGPSDSKKSSYYFFKSTPAHEAQKYMPTLLTSADNASGGAAVAPSPQPIAGSPPSSHPPTSPPPTSSSSLTSTAAAGLSRWNAAGTWEERDLSSWAHTRMTALLAFKSATSPALEVSCTSVTGDATLVFTRGKKKAGYDLNIQCEWRGRTDGAGGNEVKGGIEMPSIDPTSDDDYEMTVTVKDRGAADDDSVDKMTRAAKKLRETITSKIKQFEKELQEQ